MTTLASPEGTVQGRARWRCGGLRREGAAAPIWGTLGTRTAVVGVVSRRPFRAPRSGTSASPWLGCAKRCAAVARAVEMRRSPPRRRGSADLGDAWYPDCCGRRGFPSPVPGSALRDERISMAGMCEAVRGGGSDAGDAAVPAAKALPCRSRGDSWHSDGCGRRGSPSPVPGTFPWPDRECRVPLGDSRKVPQRGLSWEAR
jgi:hypothetical protein